MLQCKKTTVKQIQRLAGLLNFFTKAIIPARAFTRRLYSVTCKISDKPHYHVRLPSDVKKDLQLWKFFLNQQQAVARPFTDFSIIFTAQEIDMFTDSSANPLLGCGGYCGSSWFERQWNQEFIIKYRPSINFLELYAVTVAVVLWLHRFKNKRIVLFCDNLSVVNMINNSSSKCMHCMTLIRIIVLHGLMYNTRVNAKHVMGKNNIISDLISRRKFQEMNRYINTIGKELEDEPTQIPDELWPLNKVWKL